MRARLLAVLGALVGVTLLVGPARAEAGPDISVGGIRFGYLPGGLGQASDFTYEYDDVAFTSRVWESPEPAVAGGSTPISRCCPALGWPAARRCTTGSSRIRRGRRPRRDTSRCACTAGPVGWLATSCSGWCDLGWPCR